MKSKLTRFGPLFILTAAVLWGLDGLLRRSLFTLPPILIVFYEHLIGSLVITPFALPHILKAKFTRQELLAVVWVSLASGLIGTLWFTSALAKVNFIPFSVVFLLQKLQPIFAISTASVLLKEKISPRFALWSALALISAFFVTFENGFVDLNTGSQTTTAALLAVGAALAWGSSTAVSRYALLDHSHTTITGLRFLLTSAFALITVYVLGQSSSLFTPTMPQIYRLIAIALSTGAVALWLYYRGLKHTKASVSTILELAFPLTAVIIDIFVFKTFLAPTQYLAALVLIFAIYQISRLNTSR